MAQPIFRFAPSPNGYLHLGHAYSALFSQNLCAKVGGTMLLRMEDTDIGRCSQIYEEAIIEDLTWLGFNWQGEIRRQSEHLDHYASILDDLENEELAYPSFMSRGETKQFISAAEEKTGITWPRDPDGAAHYPDIERHLDEDSRTRLRQENPNFALRLNIDAAQGWLKRQNAGDLTWREMAPEKLGGRSDFDPVPVTVPVPQIEQIICEPEQWGDLVLGRRDIPAAYHLACVVDDNLQGVTHVVRGKDIMPATSVHRLLQKILGFNDPLYCHHDLIVDDEGNKFSKRHGETALRDLRKAGKQPEDIYKMIGIKP